MCTVRGAAPTRSRHRGTNRFHLLLINVQPLGLEMIASRQYRQTWVKETIGFGLVRGTKAAHSATSSGGRRYIGRRRFLKEATLCRIPLSRSSRASTCRLSCQHSTISWHLRVEPYFGHQRGYMSTRHRRHYWLYACEFHRQFLV